MKRRQVLQILLSSGILSVFGIGYKFLDLNKELDLAYLEKSAGLINALSEDVLPRTETPGASDARVWVFIIDMVKNCMDIKSANKFIEGLKNIENHCFSEYGVGYISLKKKDRVLVMKNMEKSEWKLNGLMRKVKIKILGKSFFETLREYTIKGYCTSKIGANEGLAYMAIPGRLLGCENLKKGQKSWATN